MKRTRISFRRRCRRRRKNRTRQWQQLRRVARACLRRVTEEGELTDRCGRYRLHLPYFDLPGGYSLVFMDVVERGGEVFWAE